MDRKSLLVTVGILGAIGVGLGAFGAHGLKSMVTPDRLETWRTGVTYHMFHTLGLLAIALGGVSRAAKFTVYAWLVGILLFSGSLYALTLTGKGILGAVAPLGGLAFILGWVGLAIKASQLSEPADLEAA